MASSTHRRSSSIISPKPAEPTTTTAEVPPNEQPGIGLILTPGDHGVIFAIASLRDSHHARIQVQRTQKDLPDQVSTLSGPGFLGSINLSSIPADDPNDPTLPKRILRFTADYTTDDLLAMVVPSRAAATASSDLDFEPAWLGLYHAEIDRSWTKVGVMKMRRILFSNITGEPNGTWGVLVTVYVVVFPDLGGLFALERPTDLM